MKYTLNTTLSSLTSFKIGGRCKSVIFPENGEDVKKITDYMREHGEKYYILGNGTNVLFSDEGFDGHIISCTEMTEITVDEENTVVTAGAGVNITLLAHKVSKMGYEGLEFAYGIPGSVGGGVYMNAGAYGYELAPIIKSVDYFDIDCGEVKRIAREKIEFGYRKSSFMKMNGVILSAEFSLEKGSAEKSLALCDEYMRRRKEKQPLEYPSAGSVFKRCEGHFTGEMIEKCGLKGYRIGGAEVSEKHAGFIVNRGGATASDVLSLISHIKETVNKAYGVSLECEVRVIGE
jgi:UDP-N-acetylmuramate dehydrogenase